MSAHVTDRLSAYLDGELPQQESAHVRRHLASCGECAGRLEELAAVDRAAGSLPAEAPEGYFDSLPRRVHQRLERRRRPAWRVPVWSLAAAAVLVLAVVTPLTLRQAPEPAYEPAPAAAPRAAAPVPSKGETPLEGLGYVGGENEEARPPTRLRRGSGKVEGQASDAAVGGGLATGETASRVQALEEQMTVVVQAPPPAPTPAPKPPATPVEGLEDREVGFAAAPEPTEKEEAFPSPITVAEEETRAKKGRADGLTETDRRSDVAGATARAQTAQRREEYGAEAQRMDRSARARYEHEAQLIGVMKTGSSAARSRAARELGRIAGGRAVLTLIWALQQEDLELRLGAVEALGELGPAAKAALPQLKLLRDEEPEVTVSATRERVETEALRTDIRRAAREAIAKIER